MGVPERALSGLGKRSFKKARSQRHLTDGIIKAEALKGSKVITNNTATKLPNGTWLELVKTEEGKGFLRLRTPAQDVVLIAVPLSLVTRMDSPAIFRDPLLPRRLLASCSSRLNCLAPRSKIFEVEATVKGARVHAAFRVNDPEGWMAAVRSPEWCV